MKVVGYTALRYGADYLGWAIRSVIDYLDEYHVLYATQPSHGHWSAVVCPETEAELYDIAQQAAGAKLRWHSGDWQQEGQQRNAIHEVAPDADVIFNVDYDEIWQSRLIENVLNYVKADNPNPVRYIRLPLIHYWRSFYKCVLHDPAFPARAIFPKIQSGELGWTNNMGLINHLGYAIKPDIMRYKWLIHGHLSELRKDVNWYQDVYLANRQYDCHPVGSQYWTPEDVNPFNFMPEFMINHPFYGKKVIE
jgi:hypothetical protein